MPKERAYLVDPQHKRVNVYITRPRAPGPTCLWVIKDRGFMEVPVEWMRDVAMPKHGIAPGSEYFESGDEVASYAATLRRPARATHLVIPGASEIAIYQH